MAPLHKIHNAHTHSHARTHTDRDRDTVFAAASFRHRNWPDAKDDGCALFLCLLFVYPSFTEAAMLQPQHMALLLAGTRKCLLSVGQWTRPRGRFFVVFATNFREANTHTHAAKSGLSSQSGGGSADGGQCFLQYLQQYTTHGRPGGCVCVGSVGVESGLRGEWVRRYSPWGLAFLHGCERTLQADCDDGRGSVDSDATIYRMNNGYICTSVRFSIYMIILMTNNNPCVHYANPIYKSHSKNVPASSSGFINRSVR